MEEILDVLNEKGIKVGARKSKVKIHEDGDWHCTAHVWIFNTDGQVLLQRRSLNKSTFPGMWDISVAGHVAAGESSEEAALRELHEEIGLEAHANDLHPAFIQRASHQHLDKGWQNNEFYHVYLMQADLDCQLLNLQTEEVDEVAYYDLEVFEKSILDQVGGLDLVPDAAYHYKVLEHIKAAVSPKSKAAQRKMMALA